MSSNTPRLSRSSMLDRRINIPKNKADFVRKLTSQDDGVGPFRLQADVLAFAAAFGARHGSRQPLKEATKDPIRAEVFNRQGYDTLVNLLAIYNTHDPDVLADTDKECERRALIFEEYANGGLHILEDRLKGATDLTESLMLIIKSERVRAGAQDEEDFDLTNILE